MALETATYVNQLVATNPVSGDPKSQGDDQIRLVKSTLKNTLPNLGGAMTASEAELNILDGATLSTAELNILDGVTASAAEINILDGATLTVTELNFVDGVTSPIQAQIDAETAARIATDALKAPLASPALTGTPTAPTAAPGTNTTQIATMEALQQAAFSAALPAGVDGAFLSFQAGAAVWAQAPNQIVRLAKSANYTMLFADRADLVDCTSTFTLSLDAAATLGNGWFCYVRNNGTGLITLDPSGAETIDGASTAPIQPGEVRIVQCDGFALRTIRIYGGSSGIFIARDQKTSGTSGGATSATTVQVRALQTTILNTLEGASLASNAVTLSLPGTYEFFATVACGNGTGGSRAYIFNDTDSTYAIEGCNVAAISDAGTMVVFGVLTTTASKTFTVRHYSGSGSANGLGTPVGDSRPEIYATLQIRRLS